MDAEGAKVPPVIPGSVYRIPSGENAGREVFVANVFLASHSGESTGLAGVVEHYFVDDPGQEVTRTLYRDFVKSTAFVLVK